MIFNTFIIVVGVNHYNELVLLNVCIFFQNINLITDSWVYFITNYRSTYRTVSHSFPHWLLGFLWVFLTVISLKK